MAVSLSSGVRNNLASLQSTQSQALAIQNRLASLADAQASTPLSDALSKALKQRGFRFVGTTICYAFMQAAGLVNDHSTDCFRHAEVAALSSRPL